MPDHVTMLPLCVVGRHSRRNAFGVLSVRRSMPVDFLNQFNGGPDIDLERPNLQRLIAELGRPVHQTSHWLPPGGAYSIETNMLAPEHWSCRNVDMRTDKEANFSGVLFGSNIVGSGRDNLAMEDAIK